MKPAKREVGGKIFFFLLLLFGQMSEVLGACAFQGRRISAARRSYIFDTCFMITEDSVEVFGPVLVGLQSNC